MHNWITGIGFPKNRGQFSTHRDITSTTPDSQRSISSDIGDVGAATPDKAMYSDANLMILSNKNNNFSKYEELITFVKDRSGHDLKYAIDAKKISNELNWKPQETFDTGIHKTVKWYLDNEDWCNKIMKKNLKNIGV